MRMSLHAAALIDLEWGDAAGDNDRALDRIIASLEIVSRVAAAPAAALIDLSAARLVRASRRDDPNDLLLALDAATRARDLAPRSAAALFDRALALELLGLDFEAKRGWDRFLSVEPESKWASEARARSMAIVAHADSVIPPPLGALWAALDSFAARAPARARAFGLEDLLGGWGDSVLTAQAEGAHAALEMAAALGDALARQDGDRSVADAVRTIRAQSGNEAATRALARAHAGYLRAQTFARSTQYAAADTELAAVQTLHTPPGPLTEWVNLARGVSLTYGGHPDQGEALFRAVAMRADSVRYPALSAAAHWNWGTMLSRRRQADASFAAFHVAQRQFARIGESENLGAVEFGEGEELLLVGNDADGFALLHRALLRLRAYPFSVRRHNALFVLARAASARGLMGAARGIEDEDLTLAEAINRGVTVVESRLQRADALWAAGQHDSARAIIDAAAHTIEAIPPGALREQLGAQLLVTRATGPLRSDPVRARATLDSVLRVFPAGRTNQWMAALAARADAALALGQIDAAAADLAAVESVYVRARRDAAGTPTPAATLQGARDAVDRLVLVQLRQGRTREALTALERGRSSFLPGGGLAGDAVLDKTAGRGPPARLRPHRVEHANVTWTIIGGQATVRQSVIDRARFASTVERVRSALEIGAIGAGTHTDLTSLYDWLVRPSDAALLGAGGRLTIVADEEIAAVPFAALFDATRSEYLVERRAIRVTPALANPVGSTRRGPPADSGRLSLLVANPTTDWRAFPGLDPLPLAEVEVRLAAQSYPTARVLRRAPPPIARRSWRRRSSGRRCSISRDTRCSTTNVPSIRCSRWRRGGSPPRRSPPSICAGCGWSSYRHARRCGLVRGARAVSPACRRRLSPRAPAASSAASGRVDDASTSVLMETFHQAYRASGDAAGALREAQLALIHSTTPALHSPAAWGAFRYTGQ